MSPSIPLARTSRADAIVAGIKAIDGPNKELKEQLAHSLIAVHDEIERVEKLERERGEEDELIRFLRFVIQRYREAQAKGGN